MLAQLPDECKRAIWQYFEAQELCRMTCVARGISNGASADAVWKQRTRALIAQEQTRAAAHRTPVECGLTRQNARRDLLTTKSSSPSLSASRTLAARISHLTSRDEVAGCEGARNGGDCDAEMVAEDSTYWRHWYRDFHVVSRWLFFHMHSLYTWLLCLKRLCVHGCYILLCFGIAEHARV